MRSGTLSNCRNNVSASSEKRGRSRLAVLSFAGTGTSAVREDRWRPGIVQDIRRGLGVEIKLAHKTGDRKAGIALDRYSRVRAASAVTRWARQAVALKLLASLRGSVPGFAAQLEQA
jgi:hypothetical protein